MTDKLKWCHRSPGPPSKFEKCIGAECMAWRENIINAAIVPTSGQDGGYTDEQFPHADGWVIVKSINPDSAAPKLKLIQRDGGFCGLAGKP